ncbi:hypothetical protein FQN57_004006 [Myotisia sp. PD_48]|nr:hypothetical protein FQN57_004006 [Myotisia sp. PD_48]
MAPLPVIETSKPTLSSNDSAVLQALFDAESSLSNKNANTDTALPKLPNISESEIASLQARELQAIQRLQVSPEEHLSSETINTAISELSAIINDNPRYAPAYLNRAQAIRLLIDARQPYSSSASENSPNVPLSTLLFENLSKTIALLTPESSESLISPFHSRTLASAYTHRAYILYKVARSKDEKEKAYDREHLLPLPLQDLSDERLEDMASFDFQLGGRYGNEAAKQMAVGTNPYAKMCGAIVQDAMKAEIAQWNGA